MTTACVIFASTTTIVIQNNQKRRTLISTTKHGVSHIPYFVIAQRACLVASGSIFPIGDAPAIPYGPVQNLCGNRAAVSKYSASFENTRWDGSRDGARANRRHSPMTDR
jgi:hypothetical protein